MPTVDTKKETKTETKKKVKPKKQNKRKEKIVIIPDEFKLKPVATRSIKNPKKFTFKGIDNKVYELTEKQKLFVELYMDPFTSAVQAVVDAGYDVYTKKGNVNINMANSIASENLRKPNMCQYITKLLGEAGLTDEVVDKHLLYNITQYQSLDAKNKAIDIYNRMMGRYAPERHQVSILDKYKGYSDQQLKAIINGEIIEDDL